LTPTGLLMEGVNTQISNSYDSVHVWAIAGILGARQQVCRARRSAPSQMVYGVFRRLLAQAAGFPAAWRSTPPENSQDGPARAFIG